MSLLLAKSSSDCFTPTLIETSTTPVIDYGPDLLAYFVSDLSSELCFYFPSHIRRGLNLIGSLDLISNFVADWKSLPFQFSEWAHLCWQLGFSEEKYYLRMVSLRYGPFPTSFQ